MTYMGDPGGSTHTTLTYLDRVPLAPPTLRPQHQIRLEDQVAATANPRGRVPLFLAPPAALQSRRVLVLAAATGMQGRRRGAGAGLAAERLLEKQRGFRLRSDGDWIGAG